MYGVIMKLLIYSVIILVILVFIFDHHTILTCTIANVINLVIIVIILSTGLGSGGLNKR